MKEFSALSLKMYIYLTDSNDENKTKKKGRKRCVVKRKLKFQDYKHFLETTQLENKINQLEKK